MSINWKIGATYQEAKQNFDNMEYNTTLVENLSEDIAIHCAANLQERNEEHLWKKKGSMQAKAMQAFHKIYAENKYPQLRLLSDLALKTVYIASIDMFLEVNLADDI